MNAIRFFDTNIFLYAYDLDAPAKRAVALRLVEQAWASLGETAISVQVLQEMHVNLEKRGVPQAEASEIIQDYARWPVVDSTLALLQAGLHEQSRWQLSLWDALILVVMDINTMTFAARDFAARRGASDEHTLDGSVRSEPRSLAAKDLPPFGLRRIWPVASLRLGHRTLPAMLPRRASPQAKLGATNVIVFMPMTT